MTLPQRTNATNAWGADFLLSVHINAVGGTGNEDFVYPGAGAPTSTYQNTIHAEILKLVNYTDRGKKQENFLMLRESNMPSLLTENGFIDNANNVAKLKSASFIESLARGHTNGIAVKKAKSSLSRWRNTYNIYGAQVFLEERRGKSSKGSPSTKDISAEKKLEKAEPRIGVLIFGVLFIIADYIQIHLKSLKLV